MCVGLLVYIPDSHPHTYTNTYVQVFINTCGHTHIHTFIHQLFILYHPSTHTQSPCPMAHHSAVPVHPHTAATAERQTAARS